MLDHVDDFFPLLIQFLSDRSKEVAHQFMYHFNYSSFINLLLLL